MRSSTNILVKSGSLSRLPLWTKSNPEPTVLQSALSFPESARLVCFSVFNPLRKLDVLMCLVSVSSQSSSRISLEPVWMAARLLSPSFYVMLSSLNRPPPLDGPVPKQNFSSSNEWVDEPVTSHICDEKVGDLCEVFRFWVELVCRCVQSLRCSVLSLLPPTFFWTFSMKSSGYVAVTVILSVFNLPFRFLR